MAAGFRVIATENIPESALDELARDWSSIASIGTRERMLFRSAEPPTILQVIGSLIDWTAPLKLAAVAFATALGKNAAEDAWKNKAAIGRALSMQSTQILYTASTAILNVGTSIPRPVQIAIGLDFPDPYFGPSFQLSPGDPEDGAAKIAALVVKAQQIQELLRKHEANGQGPLGPVHLELDGSGEVQISWMGHERKSYSFTV